MPRAIFDEEDMYDPPYGFVVDCETLNVYESPNTSSSCIGTLNNDEGVTVGLFRSTDSFCFVSTIFGLSGYCEKQFIDY